MPQNPLPRGRPRAPLHNTTEAGLQRCCFAIDLAQRKRVMLQVQMSIGEPGQNNAAFQILARGALKFASQILPANCQNHSVIENKRGGRRLAFFERV